MKKISTTVYCWECSVCGHKSISREGKPPQMKKLSDIFAGGATPPICIRCKRKMMLKEKIQL